MSNNFYPQCKNHHRIYFISSAIVVIYVNFLINIYKTKANHNETVFTLELFRRVSLLNIAIPVPLH